MNEREAAQYHDRLAAELLALAREEELGCEARQTVTLDQQAVGRLSRMDALQGQAMANATKARRAEGRSRIEAALQRIRDGEFGYCLECGDAIAPRRLEINPTAATCITCASA